MVVRGAYTISSFMEGTGTNLRLPLNPPFAAEIHDALQHADRHLCPRPLWTRALRPEQPDPYHKAQPSACGIPTSGPRKSSSGT